VIFRTGIQWAIVAGLFIVLAGASVEYKRRGGLYWYDVQKDYRYAFDPEFARKIQVQITPQGFTVPSIDEAWDTAVLPIHVKTSVAGHWFEPSIELKSGEARSLQYFERGTEGQRFILLRPDIVKPGRPVSMSGRHITWTEQGRELVLFSNPEATRGRTLVIAPHPDDAEIAAFGFYSRHDSFVATITAGDSVDDFYQHLEPEASSRRLLRGNARVWDSLVVPTWGGVQPERIVNLGYWNESLPQLFARRESAPEADHLLEQDPNVYRGGAVKDLLDGRSAEATWDSLVDDLRVLLENVRPAVIIAPHPLLDAAPDHQFTTIALLEALEEGVADNALLLLYTNHHVLSEYYPFGPASTEMTLPPWFDNDALFGGVFSYVLDPIDRQRKLFALEAMHDLRAAPRSVTAEDPVARFSHLAANALRELKRNPLGTYSYFRRAVRTNELFFIYRFSDRSRIGVAEREGFSYQ
jgi:LmbE family N-acetylglucosaminyl deacetylase